MFESSMKSAAQKMLIDFENTRSISHKPTKGRARESIVLEEFLKPYLPSRYSISTGIIIDSEGHQSKQQDLVIYDEFNSPILKDLQSDKLFFSESVFAVLEVKSVLANGDVEDIVQKSVSVWGLSKTRFPALVLSPRTIVPSGEIPILCMGMCFEARMSLEDALLKLRELRFRIHKSHALGLLCILKDKNEEAGLVVNVSEDDLSRIQIVPSPTGRLAILKCESLGDALLYTYLILMEHLRNCGAIMPGPNLMEYAKASGLGFPEHRVPKSEMKGAYVTIDGKKMSVDAIELVRELSMRVLKGNATDAEILEWFFYLPHVPSGEALLEEDAIFADREKPLPMPGPRAVHDAVRRYREQRASADDKQLLDKFIKLIRSIKQEDRDIKMGVFRPR